MTASIREMAPSTRREALNDHWSGWNFRKLVKLRTPTLIAMLELTILIILLLRFVTPSTSQGCLHKLDLPDRYICAVQRYVQTSCGCLLGEDGRGLGAG